ncbi:Protein of unknown function [Rhodanobacter glycinis]|uniref:DUF726 domain-containing protein n=2 Tax=Rhodanobacter glycinis TaxID=582702 RepID=A0A1I4G1G7_9GAMM|nr:Protein of unknown function [Rhodanobacter glycinis]
MTDGRLGHCSACFKKTWHRLEQKNVLRRNVYQCMGLDCGHYTLLCRVPECHNFAMGHSKGHKTRKDGSFIDRFKDGWHSEFCAEHDGTIGSFERLGDKLNDISDFRSLFDGRKTNFVKAATITSAVIGGVVVIGLTAGAAAPEIAAILGNAGLLGAASTGTAISTLSGAALTSASLSAIGSGGVLLITASGAALGGTLGGVVSSKYAGEIKDFNIIKEAGDCNNSVLFVNGFLNQAQDNLDDWRDGAGRIFKGYTLYLATWESKTLASLGGLFAGGASKAALSGVAIKAASRATKKAAGKFNPLGAATIAADVIGNDWHTAMVKAAMTGVLLADIMSRTPEKQYTLVGHSLGCRVIYYALEALSTRAAKPVIRDVILLGGAVGADDELGWRKATEAVSGKIYNCFSGRDGVLSLAYKGANALSSDPIGLRPISYQTQKIVNFDCTEFIGGHTEWKPKFDMVLSGLEKTYLFNQSLNED